jgi:hypothetical protein
MWRRVDLVWPDVSEERIASIFRVENTASEEPAWACGCRLSLLVPPSQFFLPCRWRRYVSPKRLVTQDLHGATSQKTAFLNLSCSKSLIGNIHGKKTSQNLNDTWATFLSNSLNFVDVQTLLNNFKNFMNGKGSWMNGRYCSEMLWLNRTFSPSESWLIACPQSKRDMTLPYFSVLCAKRRQYIVTWMVKAVSSPCRAEPSRTEPGRAVLTAAQRCGNTPYTLQYIVKVANMDASVLLSTTIQCNHGGSDRN